MKKRRADEPRPQFSSQSGLWHDSGIATLPLGCLSCPEVSVCGGLRTNIPLFDCTSLCSCADPSQCDTVCRRNPRYFVERFREIGGFDLASVRRTDAVLPPELPDVIPLIFHRSSREAALDAPAVALPFRELVDLRAGQLTARTRSGLADRFLVSPHARIVLSGVAKDDVLERWWRYPHREKVIDALKRLEIDIVTAPNFSLFTDVPRWDNLHAMKRIAETWCEFSAAGLSTALHLNARTDRDYGRWTEFIGGRAEIVLVAFEFGTAAGWPSRIEWHVEHLCRLAEGVGRPLTLIVRGGVRALPALRGAFRRVIFIDTHSFPRTINRRKAYLPGDGRLRWHTAFTAKGAPLDHLLAQNVQVVASWVRSGDCARRPAIAPSHTRPAQDRDEKTRQQNLL